MCVCVFVFINHDHEQRLPVEMLELVLLKAANVEIIKAAKVYPLDKHSVASTRLKSVCHDWWIIIGTFRRHHRSLLQQQIHRQYYYQTLSDI